MLGVLGRLNVGLLGPLGRVTYPISSAKQLKQDIAFLKLLVTLISSNIYGIPLFFSHFDRLIEKTESSKACCEER
ncbi:hypothetical protein AAHA92_08002 [Salvia divinorum]|uniref:Uncharacterized protein n=1 Tax=Salvia divinorum TaxID=28513 RepID=A0ABD1HQ93_SALDI